MTGSFAPVAQTSRDLASTSSRTAKRALIADLLRGTEPDELALVAAWLSGGVRQRRLGVGWSTLRAAGDEPAGPGATIAQVDEAFEALATTSGAGSTAVRAELLRTLWRAATPPERDFITRLVTGDLRQGALESLVADGAAEAFGVPAAALRRSAMLLGSTPAAVQLAGTAGRDGLEAVRLGLGIGVQPMLASPAPDVATAVATTGLPAVVDHKLDGIRLQVHREGDRVWLFTRSLDEISARLPGVVRQVLALPAEQLVLDAELLGLGPDGRPAPFQQIAAVAASTPAEELDPAVELQLFCFDLLHLDGEDWMDRPLHQRRARLVELLPASMVVDHVLAEDVDQAQAAFERAVADGFEGVVVKALDGPWQAGRRAAKWVKVKPRHTLDLVVLGAEWGYGRRTGWLSNLHLAARDGDRLVMVGKTFKGLTDELLRWQTERFGQLEVRRTRSTVFIRPEVVVEVAVDGVQQSTRYPGGVALRFARVVRYRPDKTAEQATSIEQVRSLWRAGGVDVEAARDAAGNDAFFEATAPADEHPGSADG
ncbi:ATP-dependent DNA ligase [Luteococcus peritonei]|uniref:DNA ligase (ATP) n=1 Tax=Luteococcus peritonei TaxID=88874 RepID=A0ABW4RUH8_9ACTN